jgi:light-regulated signal transduction histidine kinase (bacteriophytochrome)
MITNYMQLLRRKYSKALDENAMDYIEYAIDGSKRMQTMINDLLFYSRIGNHQDHFERIDALEPLNMAIDNLKEVIELRKADIRIGKIPEIVADRSLMVILFQNLISNAIKFTDDDVYPHIVISSQEKDDEFLFSINDNGIGIEQKDLSDIFNIFKMLHSSEEYPGTGMGLAMCKRITDKHKGKIWASSDKKKGSIFYFTIPKISGVLDRNE